MYTLIETVQQLNEFITDKIQAVREFLIYADIESTGLDWFKDDIVLLQMKIDEEIFLVDVRKLGYNNLKWLIIQINANARQCVFHNAKFDLKFIRTRTGVMLNWVYDTMLAEAILNAGHGKQFYSLDELAVKYTDIFMDKEHRMDFVGLKLDQPLTISMLNYAALDVHVLQGIKIGQMDRATEERAVSVLHLDMDLTPVVAEMEWRGIKLDCEAWLRLERVARARRDELNYELKEEIVTFLTETKIRGVHNGFELATKARIPVKTKKLTKFLEEFTSLPDMKGWLAENFNVNSPTQMKALLNLMHIKVANTNEKTLENFKQHGIVQKLLDIREVEKKVSMYGEGFLKDVNEITGRVHTEYFTVGTQTGRFSSQKPNLQNIPVDGGYRECFIPEDDFVFVAADYSQQEYRLAGAVSKEPEVIKAYQEGSDMHTATAAIIFNKDRKDVTKDERHIGKTMNFAILYGSTEWGLKRNLKVPIERAQELIQAFFDGYPRLKLFKEMVEDRILELGYSCTPYGRRRYSPDRPNLQDGKNYIIWQDRVKREGFNHIIQGGGADIIKIAMVNISKKNPFGDKFRLILQVHDELVCEVHKSIVQEAEAFLVKEMIDAEQPFLGVIPAKVDSSVRDRWSK